MRIKDSDLGQAYPTSGISLPFGWTFVARQLGGAHEFWSRNYDEAMRKSRTDAVSMRRDTHLMSIVNERRLATYGLPWHLVTPDEKNPQHIRVRDGLTRLIRGIPLLNKILWWLTDAIWYGRQGVQVEWRWDSYIDRLADRTDDSSDSPVNSPAGAPPGGIPGGGGMPMSRRGRLLRYQGMPPGMTPGGPGGPPGAPSAPGIPPPGPQAQAPKGKLRRGLSIGQAWPVMGDKIGHREDGTPLIYVNGSEANRLPNAHIEHGTTMGMSALVLDGTWRNRFLIHTHENEDSDPFSPDAAEAMHGLGIRSFVFWYNWLKWEFLGNITDFFDRVGLGLTIWKYPRGNAQALESLRAAAHNQSERAHIFVPVDPDGGKSAGNEVERMEVPTSGATALRELIQYIDTAIQRFIIGQEGSASATSASGHSNKSSSEFQWDTKANLIRFDSNNLASTLTGAPDRPGLIDTIKSRTFPWADFPVWWEFEQDQEQDQDKLRSAQLILQMGLALKADEVRGAGGFSEPAQSDEIVKPPQQQQQQQQGPPPGPPGMPPAGPPGPGAVPADTPPAPVEPPQAEPERPVPGGVLESLQKGGESSKSAEKPAGPSVLDALRHQRQGGLARYAANRDSDLDKHSNPLKDESLWRVPDDVYEDRCAIGDEIYTPEDAEHGLDDNGIVWDRDAGQEYQESDRYARGAGASAPEQFAWENRGQVSTSPTGLPIYHWYDSETHRTERQHSQPGTGRSRQEQADEHRAAREAHQQQQPPASLGHHDPQKLQPALEQMFGDDGWVTPEALPALVGAPKGAVTHVFDPTIYSFVMSGASRVSVMTSTEHPFIKQHDRELRLHNDGSLVMYHAMGFLKKQHQGSGLGFAMFSDAVRAMSMAGVDRIENLAGRGRCNGMNMNGYYSWPLFGYDAKLTPGWLKRLEAPDRAAKVLGDAIVKKAAFKLRKTDPKLSHKDAVTQAEKSRPSSKECEKRAQAVLAGKPKSVLDLMDTPDGQLLWLQNGYQTEMTFDLSPGSRSMQTLNKRLKASGKPPIEVPADIVAANEQRRQKRKQQAPRQTAATGPVQPQSQQSPGISEAEMGHIRQARQEFNQSYEGHCARNGLDWDTVRNLADRIQSFRHPGREAGPQTGDRRTYAERFRNDPVLDYGEALGQAMVLENRSRHQERMTDPQYQHIHDVLGEWADSQGFLAESIRSRAHTWTVPHADAHQALEESYKRSMEDEAKELQKVRESHASLPEDVRQKTQAVFARMVQERRDSRGTGMQWGTWSTPDMLETAGLMAQGRYDPRQAKRYADILQPQPQPGAVDSVQPASQHQPEQPVQHSKIFAVIDRLHQQGKSVLAGQVALTYARQWAQQYVKEDSQHHLHDDATGRFTGKGDSSSDTSGGAGPVADENTQVSHAARAFGAVFEKLKKAGAAVGHLEHVAKQWMADKLEDNVSKLPAKTQAAVRGTFAVITAGTRIAFTSYLAGQALAEKVAQKRGMSEEQAKQLRGQLATIDVLACKPVSAVLAASGIGALLTLAGGFMPVGTTAYLVYSAVRARCATARAAGELVSETIRKMSTIKGIKEALVPPNPEVHGPPRPVPQPLPSPVPVPPSLVPQRPKFGKPGVEELRRHRRREDT